MSVDKLINRMNGMLAIIIEIPAALKIIKGQITSAIVWFLLGAAIIAAIILIVRDDNSKIKRYIKYHLLKKEGDYYLILKKVNYKYVDRTNLEHEKLFKACSNDGETDRIKDRYTFSGKSDCILTAPIRRQSVVDQFFEAGYNHYSIKTDDAWKKNETKKFKMRMKPIHDPDCTAIPYLIQGIHEPTKRLEMTVSFGKSVTPTNCKLSIYKNFSGTIPFKEKRLIFDEDERTLTFNENYPIIDGKYKIEWNFEGDTKKTSS